MKALALCNNEWVFFPVEKCASNTMFNVLSTQFGWEAVGLGTGYWESDIPPSLQPSMHLLATKYKSVAVHRNPFDRMVSTWWDVTHGARITNPDILSAVGSDELLPFVRWVISLPLHTHHGRRSIYQPQTTWLKAVPISHWLRFEHLKADFIDMPFSRDVVLPQLNKGNREHWTTYCTGEAADLVSVWARHDFEQFGYSYDWQSDKAKSSSLAH